MNHTLTEDVKRLYERGIRAIFDGVDASARDFIAQQKVIHQPDTTRYQAALKARLDEANVPDELRHFAVYHHSGYVGLHMPRACPITISDPKTWGDKVYVVLVPQVVCNGVVNELAGTVAYRGSDVWVAVGMACQQYLYYEKWMEPTKTFSWREDGRESRPTLVCLCGSTRFSQAFRDANLSETLDYKVVLTIGCDMRSDDHLFAHKSPDELERVKVGLDELHLFKIWLADEVLILNVGGYIGDSTWRELQYAYQQRKTIRFLEPENAPTLRADGYKRGVIVNGRPTFIGANALTYASVVALAGKETSRACYTITYRNGTEEEPTGILTSDTSIKVKEGMIFTVIYTGDA